MRLLYLTPGCFDKGGIARYSRYQITALREILGAENVRVLSLLAPAEGGLEEPFQVTWHAGARYGAISTAQRAAFAAQTLRQCMFWRPRVLHAAHVNFTPLQSIARTMSGAATVLNVYGLEIWSGLSASRKFHLARVDSIIADCHFTARYAADEGLHAKDPCVIWDCVDLEKFKPGPADPQIAAKYGIPDRTGSFIVMSLGRLAREAAHKGYDRLIEAVAPLARNNASLRLVIAGRGDDRPRLEALAASHGIAGSVVFTGAIDEADLSAVYRHAHVFSLVSDRGHGRGEGIPLTPLEAMACGVPIIVGNEDGSQEAVVDGANGFVISPRDIKHHTEVLGGLMTGEARRLGYAAAARDVAVKDFGYGGFLAKHRAFIEQFNAAATPTP